MKKLIALALTTAALAALSTAAQARDHRDGSWNHSGQWNGHHDGDHQWGNHHRNYYRNYGYGYGYGYGYPRTVISIGYGGYAVKLTSGQRMVVMRKPRDLRRGSLTDR